MKTVPNKMVRAAGARRAVPVGKGSSMSLTVSPDLLAAAERGEVTDAEFVECVRTSLPYAWEVVSAVAAGLKAGGDFADSSNGASMSRASPS